MTGVMCALAGSGASKYTGSATVTVGTYTDPTVPYTSWGYNGLGGSITPLTWANTGAPFQQVCWFDTGTDFVAFAVDGVFPNEGWETMTVGGVPFTRASANYSVSSNTLWFWFTPSNPYGTTIGATRTVIWS